MNMPRLPRICRSVLPLALGLGIAPLALGAGDTPMGHDHAMHAAHNTMAPMDEHAQHRQATAASGYQRAVAHYHLPALQLTDSRNTTIDIAALLDSDEPTVVNFIFTSCTTICPIMSATFMQAQKQLGVEAERIRWISVSVDPEYDTPERLRAYAQRFDAGPNWHFLTGELEQIVALQKAFAVYRGDKMNHAPTTLLRMGRDHAWVRLDGLTSGAELAQEYHQLAHRH